MSTHLLDRDIELAVLQRAVTALAAGEPSLVEIKGACGTGRSALLTRTAELARSAGAVVLTAHGLPLAPHAELRIVDALVAQLARVTATTPAEAINEVLELADSTPVLLVVDDADGFDERSRDWLARLGSRVAGKAIAVAVVTGLTRHVLADAEVITARPLPPDAVAELVALRCREQASDRTITAMCRDTNGIPSVLHVVLDAMCVGTPYSAELAADAFGDVVVRAVAALPAEAGELLRAIALCGPGAGLDLACAVAELRDIGQRRALDVLVGAGLIRPDQPAPVSGVDTDRLLAGLERPARDELHARAARLAYLSAAEEAEVARLLELAPPLGEPWVMPLLRTAARRAMECGESATAVRHLERALREPADPVSKARLVLEIAVAESVHEPQAGDRRLARMLLEHQPPECARVRLDAADQLYARGDAALVRRTFGAMRITGAERDSITAMYWQAGDTVLEVAEFGLLDARPLPAAPQEPQRAGLAAWLCVAQGDDPALARRLARATLAAPATALMQRMVACYALALTDELDEAVSGLDRTVFDARDRGLNAVVSQLLVARAKVMLIAGRLTEAAADLAAARTALPPRCWHEDALPLMIAVEAQVSLEHGLVDHAEELSAAVPDLQRRSGYGGTLLLFARAELALRRGDPEAALALAQECGWRMLARGWSNPAALSWRSLAARALRARGDVDLADRLCDEEVERARSWGVPGALGLAHLSRAAVSGEAEDRREAVRLLRKSPYRLAHAAALLDLAEAGDPRDTARLAREAGEIAVRGRASVLLSRARRLGWVPGT